MRHGETQLTIDFLNYVETRSTHYGTDDIELVDYLASIGQLDGFAIANVMKYVGRFGKKDGKNKDDLLKALHYLAYLYYFEFIKGNQPTSELPPLQQQQEPHPYVPTKYYGSFIKPEPVQREGVKTWYDRWNVAVPEPISDEPKSGDQIPYQTWYDRWNDKLPLPVQSKSESPTDDILKEKEKVEEYAARMSSYTVKNIDLAKSPGIDYLQNIND